MNAHNLFTYPTNILFLFLLSGKIISLLIEVKGLCRTTSFFSTGPFWGLNQLFNECLKQIKPKQRKHESIISTSVSSLLMKTLLLILCLIQLI